jgi:outer membrane biosynthesis protein TonB
MLCRYPPACNPIRIRQYPDHPSPRHCIHDKIICHTRPTIQRRDFNPHHQCFHLPRLSPPTPNLFILRNLPPPNPAPPRPDPPPRPLAPPPQPPPTPKTAPPHYPISPRARHAHPPALSAASTRSPAFAHRPHAYHYHLDDLILMTSLIYPSVLLRTPFFWRFFAFFRMRNRKATPSPTKAARGSCVTGAKMSVSFSVEKAANPVATLRPCSCF